MANNTEFYSTDELELMHAGRRWRFSAAEFRARDPEADYGPSTSIVRTPDVAALRLTLGGSVVVFAWRHGKLARAYYAHPKSDFGTPYEAMRAREIATEFGSVVNPGDKEHRVGWLFTGYSYIRDLAESCDVCVFDTFEDGTVGAGVRGEVIGFLVRELPVYHVSDMSKRVWTAPRGLSVDETRAKLASIPLRSVA